MTNSTVPVHVDHHSPVNKGAAEAFRPAACQCADATGRVSSLREAEESERRVLTDLPPALTLRRPGPVCSLCVWASREAPGARPPLPVLLPGCSTRHTLRPGKPCSGVPREGCSRNSMVWSLSNIWSISSHKATFKRLNEAILLLCYKQPISYSPFFRVEGRSFLSKTINVTCFFLITAVFNKIQY